MLQRNWNSWISKGSLRTGNPTLDDEAFDFSLEAPAAGAVMTIQGTVNKTGLVLAILLLTSSWTWSRFYEGMDVSILWWAGLAGACAVGLFTFYNPEWSPLMAPAYAALAGLAMGGISAFFERHWPGVAIKAVSLTFGTLASLLLAYHSGLIRATENFKLAVAAATGSIAFFYVASLILGPIPFINKGGAFGIVVSLYVVVIAAVNLVLDFDFIEKGAERGAPKYMEWYGAFGLLVTLTWLYLGILRLLLKSSDRD